MKRGFVLYRGYSYILTVSALLVIFLLAAPMASSAGQGIDKFDPDLITIFEEDRPSFREAAGISPKHSDDPGKVIFFVHLNEKANLAKIKADKGNKKDIVVKTLFETAGKSQAPVLSLIQNLKSEGSVSKWQSFFISNCIAVEGNFSAAKAIAGMKEVRRLSPNYLVASFDIKKLKEDESETSMDKTVNTSKPEPGRLSALNWNVDVVDAELVWKNYNARGEGIVVAAVTTGVDWDHPALINSYRGWNGQSAAHSYNWFDMDGDLYQGNNYGQSRTLNPQDYGEMGTFTIGCMTGDGESLNSQVGVAPGSKWICVTPEGLQTSGNYFDNIMIHKTLQWLLAPTDISGNLSTARPEMAPDVIFCGFSTMNPYDETFREDIQALRAAGIFVTAPVGDVGDNPGGAASPGSYPEVFSAGAVDRWGAVYSESGRGPSVWGDIKPEISAPGVDVYGCVPGGDYSTGFTGTVVSTAHAAGLYSLLKSIKPNTSPETLEQLLRATARDLGPEGEDNTFGWGYVNVLRAANLLLAGGLVEGVVTSAADGQPIEDVTVKVTSRTYPYDSLTTKTRKDGSFVFKLSSGLYDVTYTSLFYETQYLAGIDVREGFTSLASIALKPKTTYRLSGKILDADFGVPILATISITGTGLSRTTGSTGSYFFDLPAGQYQIKVVASRHRSAHPTVTIMDDKTLDFRLESIPRILIVDAEAQYGWDKGWRVLDYYKRAFDEADYTYDVRNVDVPWKMPTLQELKFYDLVVWAQSNRSPSIVGADTLLQSYLDSGKPLLICGHNIGELEENSSFLNNYLNARYIHDDAGTLKAEGANFLDGVEVKFGGVGTSQRPPGAPSVFTPDVIDSNGIDAFPCLYYSGGQVAGVATVSCGTPFYRAVYLGVGLESIQVDQDLALMIEGIVNWLTMDREANEMIVTPGDTIGSGEIGRKYVFYQNIINTGTGADSYDLTLSESDWTATVFNQDLTQQISSIGPVQPCQSVVVAIQVQVPTSAEPLSGDQVILTVTSQADSEMSRSVNLETKAFVNWRTESQMLTPRYRQSSESLGDCSVYVIGGLDWVSGEALSVNERYDTITGTWTTMTSKPTATANCGSAVLDGKIWLVGGFNLMQVPPRLSQVETYDPETDSWELATALPYFASGVACAAYDGKLYTFGGFGGSIESDEVYSYDPEIDVWTPLEPMPGGGRSQGNAVVAGNRIYVIGGWPNLTRVEEYNPSRDRWETKTSMNQGRHSFGCETVKHGDNYYIYVFGGGSVWTGLPMAERYNVSEDAWEPIYSLTDARRAGMSSAIAGGKLYAFGGIWDRPAQAVEVLPVEGTISGSSVTVSDNFILPGQDLSYTILLENGGFLGIDNVIVENRISPWVTFIQGSQTEGLVYHSGDHSLTWEGNLGPNEQKILTFDVTVTDPPYPSALIENAVDFHGDPCGSFTKTVTTRVQGPEIIDSRKTVNKNRANNNDILDYTIYLVNRSEVYDALGVFVNDPLPEHLTYVDGSITGGASYNSESNSIEWSGDLFKASPGGFEPKWADNDTTSIIYTWYEATEVQPIEGDDIGIVVPLGFTFKWFGEEYGQVGISSNGYLTFDDTLSEPDNVCLPDILEPDNVIAPFWDDLVIATVPGDSIRTGLFGVAPDRKFVVSWKAHAFEDIGNNFPAYEFQAVLYEQEGVVQFHYKNMDAGYQGDGSSATVGIEDGNGNKGISYLCNGEPVANLVHDGLAVRFSHVRIPFLDEKTFTFQARVENDPTFCNIPIINKAELIYDDYALDMMTTTTINVTPIDETRFTVSKPSTEPGDTVVYSLLIKNNGNFFADVTASCTIPEHSTFQRIVGSQGTYNAGDNTVTWDGFVGINVVQPVSFEVKLDDPLPDGLPITSHAEVKAKCSDRDVQIDASTKVASYSLEESSAGATPAIASPGETLDYIIRLVNTGTADVDATLFSNITQDIGVVLGSVTATHGNANFDYQFNNLTWQGTIPARSTVSIVFKGKVKVSAIPGSDIVVTVQIDHPTGQTIREAITSIVETNVPRSTGWMFYGNVDEE